MHPRITLVVNNYQTQERKKRRKKNLANYNPNVYLSYSRLQEYLSAELFPVVDVFFNVVSLLLVGSFATAHVVLALGTIWIIRMIRSLVLVNIAYYNGFRKMIFPISDSQ